MGTQNLDLSLGAVLEHRFDGHHEGIGNLRDLDICIGGHARLEFIGAADRYRHLEGGQAGVVVAKTADRCNGAMKGLTR
jgi:hypothetical protein